ncbi:MAG: hypothetical protein MUE85_08860 [Microscillaceae bacterium]|jgi:hypothetical protein|nr:hypothetical protein [Microscillaceae bacterium]
MAEHTSIQKNAQSTQNQFKEKEVDEAQFDGCTQTANPFLPPHQQKPNPFLTNNIVFNNPFLYPNPQITNFGAEVAPIQRLELASQDQDLTSSENLIMQRLDSENESAEAESDEDNNINQYDSINDSDAELESTELARNRIIDLSGEYSDDDDDERPQLGSREFIENIIDFYSQDPETCQKKTADLYNHLLHFYIQKSGDEKCGAVLLMWKSKRVKALNHTAILLTLKGRVYVIDSTIAQFGNYNGDIIFVGTVQEWQNLVENLVRAEKEDSAFQHNFEFVLQQRESGAYGTLEMNSLCEKFKSNEDIVPKYQPWESPPTPRKDKKSTTHNSNND